MIGKTPLLHMLYFMNWFTYEFFTRTGVGWGGSLITVLALAHPLNPIDSRSRNKRRNTWVGRRFSSWWHLFPSRNSCVIKYLSTRMHSLCEFCYRTYIYIHKQCRSVLVKLHPITGYWNVFGECAVPVLNATFCFIGSPILPCSLMNSPILGCL